MASGCEKRGPLNQSAHISDYIDVNNNHGVYTDPKDNQVAELFSLYLLPLPSLDH